MAEPSTSSRASRPQFPPLGLALSLLAESATHRFELAAIELDEARVHAAGSLALVASVSVLTLLTGFALTLLAAALVWDSPQRGWWLAGLTFLYLAGALVAGIILRRRLRDWRPLAETQYQLSQDCRCLHNLVSPPSP